MAPKSDWTNWKKTASPATTAAKAVPARSKDKFPNWGRMNTCIILWNGWWSFKARWIPAKIWAPIPASLPQTATLHTKCRLSSWFDISYFPQAPAWSRSASTLPWWLKRREWSGSFRWSSRWGSKPMPLCRGVSETRNLSTWTTHWGLAASYRPNSNYLTKSTTSRGSHWQIYSIACSFAPRTTDGPLSRLHDASKTTSPIAIFSQNAGICTVCESRPAPLASNRSNSQYPPNSAAAVLSEPRSSDIFCELRAFSGKTTN